ncbi:MULTISPECIES: hypothetical protein [Arthrobacter]|uniref:Uncharacterized protein n=2 Tax=Arthrobacter TaxID=1663 RepID=A0ABU9KHH4_9MICC|nr:hypothetical protein [Arthrobacter sp. YJM1]
MKLLGAAGPSIGKGSVKRLSRTAQAHLRDLVARERLVHGKRARELGRPSPIPDDVRERLYPQRAPIADMRELTDPALRAATDRQMSDLLQLHAARYEDRENPDGV